MTDPDDVHQDVESSIRRIRELVDQDFTDAQLDELRKRVTESAERFNRLQAYPLANADEPAPGFRPYKKEDQSR